MSYKLRAAGLRLSVRGARRQHQKNRKDLSFSPDGGFVYRNQVTDRAIATATQEAVRAYFAQD